ncbi:MAG: tetratricopeptide repeat protein [Verrucomicrobia subdivision 3 bacterium]|nr:tetratricopeptide repeat protein [Limisphaerales bacterium]
MADETPPPPRRKWVFRLIALSLPVLFVAALEVLLRAAGYGYPTNFTLKRTHAGREVRVDNQEFARRYFPRGLERGPHPFLFPAEKPANTTRIFVLGESAAMGDPDPAYGFARTLEVLLRARYPGRNFEVINAGVTAINSHVIGNIAADLAPYQGDIWIVYAGNNEVIGPFGGGTVFGMQTPHLQFVRATIALKSLRVVQLMDELWLRLGKTRPATWEGMEMFLQQQVAADDPRMPAVYRHFEANLNDILQIARKARATVLLSTIASNLKDCPPFASGHAQGFTRTNEWAKLYEAGAARQQEHDHAGALQHLQQAAALDGRHAALQFRIARSQLALGRTNEAAKTFTRARDLDTLRFRADERLNEIIRSTANRDSKLVKLIDIADSVNRASPHGIAGDEFFFEHVHLNFEGNYLAARTFAEAIAKLLTDTAGTPPPLGLEECARRLAFTDWDRLELNAEMLRRLQQPPFTHQIGHSERLAAWEKSRADLQARWQPGAFQPAIDTYTQALATRPGDWLLHEKFAELLQNVGEPQQAAEQWRKVIDLMPHYPAGYYSLANALDGLGRSAEAIDYFAAALRAKPDSVEARNGLGLALAALGRRAEALDQYRNALEAKPDFAEARVNFAQLLAEQGDVAQARAQYELALRYNSNSAAAHINLGKLLAQEKKTDEAIRHYREALRINPANAVAHYNLGNALAAQDHPDAWRHFELAVKYNPSFAEARYNLGLHFARQGRNNDALTQFAEAARLKPGFVEAHLNYGVALAKNRQLSEAIEQFQIVLRHDPQNAAAKQMLDNALRLRPP